MATNDARMEVRLPEAEKQAVIAGAERAGQNPSVWARRAFVAALETAPSEAKGADLSERFGPASVPSGSKGKRPAKSAATASTGSDGVRPAAQSRAPSARPRRSDIGPKPASASKPRPKAGSKPPKGGKT